MRREEVMAWMGSEKPLASCGKEAASAIADGMQRSVKEIRDGFRAIAFMLSLSIVAIASMLALVAVVWLLAPSMFLHYVGHSSHDSL